MKILISVLFFSILLFAKNYSEQDWKIYKGCKSRVYESINNNYDKKVCKRMLKDKNNLKIHGAEKMYDHYIKKLYYFN